MSHQQPTPDQLLAQRIAEHDYERQQAFRAALDIEQAAYVPGEASEERECRTCHGRLRIDHPLWVQFYAQGPATVKAIFDDHLPDTQGDNGVRRWFRQRGGLVQGNPRRTYYHIVATTTECPACKGTGLMPEQAYEAHMLAMPGEGLERIGQRAKKKAEAYFNGQ